MSQNAPQPASAPESFVVDGHVHVGTWAEPGFAGRSSNLEEAAALLSSLGFRGALVTTTDWGDNQGLLEALDEYAGSLALRFAYWIDPRVPDDRDQLEAVAPRVAALKVHPSFIRTPPNVPSLAAYYELAAKHGWPVVVHCGRWREVSGYERALEVAERHRSVRFILSHMGGDEPLLVRETIREVQARKLDNVFLGTESVRQYWIVQEALDALGAGRLVFGSDYNLNHPGSFRAIVDALDMSADDRRRVLGGNLDALVPEGQRFYPDTAKGG